MSSERQKSAEEIERFARTNDFSQAFLLNAPRLSPPASTVPEEQRQREQESLERLMRQATALKDNPVPRTGLFCVSPRLDPSQVTLRKTPMSLSRSLSVWALGYLRSSVRSNEYHFNDARLGPLRTLIELLVLGDDPLPRSHNYASPDAFEAAVLRSAGERARHGIEGESWMSGLLRSRLAVHALAGWQRVHPQDFMAPEGAAVAPFDGLPAAAWLAAASGADSGTLLEVGRRCQRAWPGKKSPTWGILNRSEGAAVFTKDEATPFFWKRMAQESARAGNADALWALRDRIPLQEPLDLPGAGSPLQEWIAAMAARFQVESILGTQQKSWMLEHEAIAREFWERLERLCAPKPTDNTPWMGMEGLLSQVQRVPAMPNGTEASFSEGELIGPTSMGEKDRHAWSIKTTDHLWCLAIPARKEFAPPSPLPPASQETQESWTALEKRQKEYEAQSHQSRQTQWTQQARREACLLPARAPDGLTLASWCRASFLYPQPLQYWNEALWDDKAARALQVWPVPPRSEAERRLWIQRNVDWSTTLMTAPLGEAMNCALRANSGPAQEAGKMVAALTHDACWRDALAATPLPAQASWLFWGLALSAREQLEKWPQACCCAQPLLSELVQYSSSTTPETLQQLQAGALTSSQSIHTIAFSSSSGKDPQSREAVTHWRNHVLSTEKWEPWSADPAAKRSFKTREEDKLQAIAQAFEHAWSVWERLQMGMSLGLSVENGNSTSTNTSKRRAKSL